jgi:hypothetical protein
VDNFSQHTQLKYVYIKRMLEQLQLGIPKLLGNCLPAMLTLFDPPTSFHMMLMPKNILVLGHQHIEPKYA